MSDLIKREDAIGAVIEAVYKTLHTPIPCYGNSILQESMTLAKTIVNKIPSAESERKWIPCSEKLPEEEKRHYWVCTDTGYQCRCRWTNDVYGFGASDKWNWKIFDIPQYQKVVAWMPLPEVYKGKDE